MATKEEIDSLGHGIAYDSACSLIESNCLSVSAADAGTPGWYDIGADVVDLEAEDPVAEAVKYLEMRGLIQRHEENSDWVILLDESEASA